MWNNPTDDELTELLKRSRTIAVVGLSAKPEKDSHMIARYLKEKGYTVIPVNPGYKSVLDETCYPDLSSIPADRKLDIVNIFRPSAEVGPHVDAAIKRGAKAIWMQMGIADEEAGRRAAEAGITVVMDRCIRVELNALIGG